MDRHLTVSVYTVCQGRVLLHRHKRFGLMLPPGGHPEPGELPQDAAVREVFEETGLRVRLYDADAARGLLKNTRGMTEERLLVCPVHMMLYLVTPEHEHVDMIFYARAEHPELNPGAGEAQALFWLTASEVEGLAHCPENVKVMAAEAIRHWEEEQW